MRYDEAHVTLISIHLLGTVIPILSDVLLSIIKHPGLLSIITIMRILKTFLSAAVILIRVQGLEIQHNINTSLTSTKVKLRLRFT